MEPNLCYIRIKISTTSSYSLELLILPIKMIVTIFCLIDMLGEGRRESGVIQTSVSGLWLRSIRTDVTASSIDSCIIYPSLHVPFQVIDMANTNFSQTAAFIWAVADLLRGDFKQSQYGRVILPFTLLRRLECVLAGTKEAVLAEAEKLKASPLPEEGREKFLLRATKGLSFFNTSPMDLGKMGQNDIKANLENYVQSFSKDAREIFEHFKFSEFVVTCPQY